MKSSACSSSSPRRRIFAGLALLAGLAAICVTVLSGPSGYDERLLDIAARRTLPADVYRIADGNPQMTAMFLDLEGDRELSYKYFLALEKYGVNGRRVLDLMGDDADFQEIVRKFGENVVPVIVYFMDHDMPSLQAVSWIKAAWPGGKASDEQQRFAAYGPESRGFHAVGQIEERGHHFLGQFSIDAQGVARWNQSDRGLQAIAEFFGGGVRSLERRYDTGEPIRALDVALAGVDVFVVFGAAKAIKIISGARQAGVAARAAGAATTAGKAARVPGQGIVAGTRIFGRKALGNSALARGALRWGAGAVTVYLVARHPSLLNAVFDRIAERLGLPGWLVKGFGWSAIFYPLLLLAWPLVIALRLLLSFVGAGLRFGRWSFFHGNRGVS